MAVWGGDEQQEPLRVAVWLGDLDLCGLLIRVGKVNLLSALISDDDGQMGLKDRTSENGHTRMAILKLLVVHGNVGSTLTE